MKTLYIIDGHSQFFRAFHAIRTPMSSPVTNEPTNATFGFAGMLLKLLRGQRPDYLLVVIDVSGDRESFRSELYPEYKANREAAPEGFHPQVERCVSMLEAIGAPVIGVEGVEADDVIATVVTRLAQGEGGEDLRIRIVSKDKDLQQLLIPGRVEMYDIHTDTLIDVDKLKEEKGVTPEQVVDMLALMGDTVDNVPGVEGVGPKTAAQLVSKYGTLENLLAHADEIKGKRGEKLRAAGDLLALSKQLVTLKRDVPIDFDLERTTVSRLKLEELAPIFRELGFNRYQDELKQLLPGGATSTPQTTARGERGGGEGKDDGGFSGGLFDQHPAPAWAATSVSGASTGDQYETIATKKQLDALVKAMRKAEIVAIDTETTGLAAMQCKLCGVSISMEEGTGCYIPVRSPDPSSHLDEKTVLDALRPVLEDESVPKCGHNLKYDLLVLRGAGVRLRGIVFDSMIGSFLVDSSRSSHGMDALAQALLDYTCTRITDLIGKGKSQRTFDAVPLEQATPYAAEDADVSLRLRNRLEPELRALGLEKLSRDVETPLLEVLAEMEWNGVAVDPDELDRQAERLRTKIQGLREQIEDAAPRPFNPDSPKQLSEILFNKPDDPLAPGLGIRPLRKTKTGHSTDMEVLEKLAQDPAVTTPVPSLIVEYRQLTKLVSTYLVALKEAIHPETKRIHASFNQTVAATGRLSSSDPNLQNIPIRTEIGREIRRAFVAPPGRMLIGADYSQIELRMLAHLSRDEALLEAFRRGEDIHRAVAAQINDVKPEQVTREQRDAAKMVNFGIVYGITPWGLARRLGVGDKEAAKIIDDYKARYPGIATFLQECIAQAREHGYVETILKRRRPITGIDAKRPQDKALAERMAINSVVQGSAADLIKLAMLDLHTRITAPQKGDAGGLEGTMMLVQIHDELLFEAPEEKAEAARRVIVERMEKAMELTAPLVVESACSRTWYEGK
ncbi:MAG: DNA polymerase I [Phycisphaeraceae bacterium]|nr:MAG: DNA polymerase I [Phycisphaeraceae bacterium]